MNTDGRRFDLVNGPSKDLLFDACKYAYASRTKVVVDLEVAAGYTASPTCSSSAYIAMRIKDIVIVGIEHEDGSGDKLNLYGYCKADLRPTGYPPKWQNYQFNAYYDSRRRTGSIVFYDK